MIRIVQEKDYIDVQLLNEEGKIYKSFLEFELEKKEAELQLLDENSYLRKKVDELK